MGTSMLVLGIAVNDPKTTPFGKQNLVAPFAACNEFPAIFSGKSPGP